MEGLNANFVQFTCVTAIFIVGRETGHKTMPVVNFEIFLKFPDIQDRHS